MHQKLKKYKEILTEYWGYSAFRPLQEEIILSLSEGKDTLGLMPTGGGKSLTFQVPAMAEQGVCLVVTPLIALMKDQVQNLRNKAIKAEAIHSGMRRDTMVTLLDNCVLGGVKFLYVSPERLGTALFLEKLPGFNVKWIVVDEAHCISQWGYDFRPSYLRIQEIRQHIPEVPVLALTATATKNVVDDIQAKLNFKSGNVFKMSFERKNLVYYVKKTDDKQRTMLRMLGRIKGSSIVYVRSRKKTKELAEWLTEGGVVATYYHAGLDAFEKEKRQQLWMKDEVQVMVATNAFGMGIDKPEVRLVVHFEMPDSIESYFQEAGRGGRDGKKSFAIALYNKADDRKLKKRFTDTFPPKVFIEKVYQSLCNYFQIAVHAGADRTFDFDLNDFCKVFRYSRTQAYYAIKILQNTGHLYYSEEPENTTRLHFIVERDELFRFQEQNPKVEVLIKLILRTYSGLFSSFAYISEMYLARKAGMTREQVYEILSSMAKYKLVNYIPGKKMPQLVFKQSRVEPGTLYIGKEAYDVLKERHGARISNVLQYAASETICRSIFLLNYFGEKNGNPCGQCDVCTKKLENTLSSAEFQKISTWIQNALLKNKYTLEKLIEDSTFEEKKTINTLRWMMDNKKIIRQEDGTLEMG